MTDVFESDATVERWEADYYHPVAVRHYDRAVADMLVRLGTEDTGPLLDAGCGSGVHAVRVARAGHSVCAIDASETMLRYAREHVQRAGVASRVALQRHDLRRLGFADGSFHRVFSWGVVIHIPEAEQALDELARILAPGGRLALHLTNRSALDYKAERAARWLLRRPLLGVRRGPLGDGLWYDMGGTSLWLWRFDDRAVIRHLARHGLRLTSRRIGELSEVQRRVSGLPRRLLLHGNNAAWNLRLPPAWGCTSLLVFERVRPSGAGRSAP